MSIRNHSPSFRPRNILLLIAAVAIFAVLGSVISAQQGDTSSPQEIFDSAINDQVARRAAGETDVVNVMQTDANFGADPIPLLSDGNTCVYDATRLKRKRPLNNVSAVPRNGGSAVVFNKCAILPSGTYDLYIPGYIGVWRYRVPGSAIRKNISSPGKNVFAVPLGNNDYTQWFRASLQNGRVKGPLFGQSWKVVAHPDIEEGRFRSTLAAAFVRDMRQKISSWESNEDPESAKGEGVLVLNVGTPNTVCTFEEYVCTGATITFDPDDTDWEFWFLHQIDELSFHGEINDGTLSDDVGVHGTLTRTLSQKRKRRLHGRIPRGANLTVKNGQEFLVYPDEQKFGGGGGGGGDDGSTFDFNYPPKNTLVQKDGLIFRAPGRVKGFYKKNITMPGGTYTSMFAEVQFVQSAWPELGSNKRQRTLTVEQLVHSWGQGPRGLTGRDNANLSNYFRAIYGAGPNDYLELTNVKWKLNTRYQIRFDWNASGRVSLRVLGPGIDRRVSRSIPSGNRRVPSAGQVVELGLGYGKDATSAEPYSPKGSSWYNFAFGGTRQ